MVECKSRPWELLAGLEFLTRHSLIRAKTTALIRGATFYVASSKILNLPARAEKMQCTGKLSVEGSLPVCAQLPAGSFQLHSDLPPRYQRPRH